MKITRRTTIRFEKHERSVVRVRANFRMYCETCGKETEHLTVAQFACRWTISESSVVQLTESGALHGVAFGDGRTLVCADQSE